MAASPHGTQTSLTELPQARLTHHRLAIYRQIYRAYYSDVQAISERVAAGKGSVLLDGRTEGQFYGEEKHLNHASMDVFRALRYSRSQMPMMRAPTD